MPFNPKSVVQKEIWEFHILDAPNHLLPGDAIFRHLVPDAGCLWEMGVNGFYEDENCSAMFPGETNKIMVSGPL